MRENKFGIKTRVFLTFGFTVIFFINIFFIILYNLIESSYINSLEKNLKSNFQEITKEIVKLDNISKNNILNISQKTVKKLEKQQIFFHIGLNNKELENIYKKGSFIYEGNLIFRGNYNKYIIVLGKDISNFENFKKNIKENAIIINILSVFIVFIMSYFIANKVLKPLLKLSDYVGKYDISKEKKLIKNNYGNSEIGIITESINKLIQKSKNVIERQKKFVQDSNHELKTPLMQIETNIDILEEKITDKRFLEKIENIKKSVENMNNIISDLSFVLREENKILEKKEINMGNYLKDLALEYKEEAEKKDLKIVVKQKEKFILKNNKYYLDRLFGNLIQNSIFYNNGKGTINIKILENKIILLDSGIGIPEHDLEKVFSRFYRNNESCIYNKNGSGLGLTIVKKICDDFNWNIKIESKEGVGSRFEIIFSKN